MGRLRGGSRVVSPLSLLCLPAFCFGPSHGRSIARGDHSGMHAAHFHHPDRLQPPAGLRRLQAAVAQADVAVVDTAEGLWDAVAAGAPHIEIREHLDITGLRDDSAEKHSSLPVENLHLVQTIRGRCATPWMLDTLTAAPAEPPLLAGRPGQCMIVANGTVLQSVAQLWLDNLYLRNVYDRFDSGTLMIRAAPSDSMPGLSSLYMTSVTAQGSGANTAWLYVEQMAYIQGCTFTDGGAMPRPGFKGGPPVLIDGAASFVNCAFRRSAGVFVGAKSPLSHVLEARDSSTAVRIERCVFADNPADHLLLRVNSSSSIFADDAGLDVWDATSNTSIAVQPLASVPNRPLFLTARDPWFRGIQQELLSERAPPSSDGPSGVYVSLSAAAITVLATLSLTLAAVLFLQRHKRRRPQNRGHGSEAAGKAACKAADTAADMAADREEAADAAMMLPVPPAPTAAALTPETALWGSSRSLQPADTAKRSVGTSGIPHLHGQVDNTESVHATTVESSGSACSTHPHNAVCAQEIATHHTHHLEAPSATPSSAAAASSVAPSAPTSSRLQPSTPSPAAPSIHSLSTAVLAAAGTASTGIPGIPLLQKFSSAATCHSTTQVSVDEPAAHPDRPPPPQGATLTERMEYVQYQLDTLEGRHVLDGLTLQSGPHSRLHGGQAVIQFAEDRETRDEFAIKVFLSRRAFEDEAGLYEDDQNPLGQFLPQVRDIVHNRDSRFADGSGRVMPQAIVMEKGESLDVWMLRSAEVGIDMVTGLQVVTHMSERLLDLHRAGYVHRDLKPSNIMWLPRGNRWTLIDFGCAARVGAVAPLNYSLAYAAPEVITACAAGAKTITVTGAMDAWALGVVAVELFSNDVVCNLVEGSAMVRQRILGQLPLPWEDPERASAIFRSLGRFKGAVMALLRRDASQRISIDDFVRQARRVLTHTTNTTNEA